MDSGAPNDIEHRRRWRRQEPAQQLLGPHPLQHPVPSLPQSVVFTKARDVIRLYLRIHPASLANSRKSVHSHIDGVRLDDAPTTLTRVRAQTSEAVPQPAADEVGSRSLPRKGQRLQGEGAWAGHSAVRPKRRPGGCAPGSRPRPAGPAGSRAPSSGSARRATRRESKGRFPAAGRPAGA
jgi:hypothetical protein